MEYHDKEITSIAYQKEDATLTFTILENPVKDAP